MSASHLFWRAAAVTLALLLLLTVSSDLGTLRGVWDAPLFLLHRSHDWFSGWVLSRVLLPACMLNGVVAAGNHWRSTRQ